MRVIFFGSSRYVVPIIEVLLKNFNLSLVVTNEKSPSDPVPFYCIKNKISYLSVSNLSNPKLNVLSSKFKVSIGVLASFGAIVPKSILEIFKFGILNVHPSLLPKYRGPTPVQTAILDGDKATGVSIIKLDEEIDHGPILTQIEEPIFENDTAESLYERLFRIGGSSIVSTIELYLKGKIKPKEQNHSNATFTKHLTRQDGYVDISKLNPSTHSASSGQKSKIEIDRMIRAYYPWPSVWTELKIRNHELRIKFLPHKKIQVEGKKPMSYKDFVNGYPEAGKIVEKLT